MEPIITPWEVKGEIDYDKLIKQFGTSPINDEILNRFKKYAGGELHLFLRRRIFFSHRDFDWILDKYDQGEKFFLYTGRGPSGKTHFGHLIPWIFTKYLQDVFGAELYFQITNDEKYLVKPLSLEETTSFAYDNILDIIACGFDARKTKIFINTEYAKTLYKIAVKFAKHVTFSTAKAVFGFKNENNIGIIFFPAMQAAPCFLPSIEKGKNVPCLIPAAIDQDPYWRIARDVAPKLGFYKPAQIHSIFVPGLGAGGKMSSSEPSTCIFTTDSPDEVHKKIMNAFTGGKETKEKQMKEGGEPDKCMVYQYFFLLFEPDDEKLVELYTKCRSGKILCGQCKLILSERVQKFILEHQKKREKARKKIKKFIVRD